MIAPTEDELSFLRALEERGGQIALQGNTALLKIDRLIPDYVTHVRASGVDAKLFTLTRKGRQLLRAVDQGGAW
jgi:hypothetical protein